jgi:hypothetical protein
MKSSVRKSGRAGKHVMQGMLRHQACDKYRPLSAQEALPVNFELELWRKRGAPQKPSAQRPHVQNNFQFFGL